MVSPHIDISEWLRSLNLMIYLPCFQNFNGVEDMINLSENDIKNLGVRNGAHRAKICSSLVLLVKTFQKRNEKTGNETMRRNIAKQSSLGNNDWKIKSAKMEPVVDCNASAEELKKALDWELKLDNRDLRSHAWYHGTIPRHRGEELLEQDGDFLIRDCISQPGDFVLTCYHSKNSLHFVINKVVLQPHTVYERIQYQFEDDSFDTIPDLVTYYVGNKRPISVASGAVIHHPINRSMPLSYYASKYGMEQQKTHVSGTVTSATFSPKSSPKQSPRQTPKNSPPVGKKIPFDQNQKPKLQNFEVNSPYSGGFNKTNMVRVGSDPMLSPTIERKPLEFRYSGSLNSTEVLQHLQDEANSEKAPPKPSRIPSMRSATKPEVTIKRKDPILESNKENYPKNSPKSPLPSPGPTLPDKHRQVSTMEARLTLLKHKRQDSGSSIALSPRIPITEPEEDPKSCFKLENYRTYLLPSSGENKPLEISALLHVKTVLLDTGSMVLASHITQVDLRVLKLEPNLDHGLGISSGLELMLLPQGKVLRQDIVERAECLKLFVAVSILMCSNNEERSSMINKWIQVAYDIKTALGNLYGFHNIMSGLLLPQIGKLESTWLLLRQNSTHSAFTYETKLRPTMKAMLECNNPEAPNTSIPFIIPIASILDHEPNFDTSKKSKPHFEVPWEEPGIDYGLNLLFKHMEVGRNFFKNAIFFRRNQEIVLEKAKFDEVIVDMFSTEFHLKFLWGSKGATVSNFDRYSKFQQVLDAMHQRCEKR